VRKEATLSHGTRWCTATLPVLNLPCALKTKPHPRRPRPKRSDLDGARTYRRAPAGRTGWLPERGSLDWQRSSTRQRPAPCYHRSQQQRVECCAEQRQCGSEHYSPRAQVCLPVCPRSPAVVGVQVVLAARIVTLVVTGRRQRSPPAETVT
jgi:hypothetical protein